MNVKSTPKSLPSLPTDEAAENFVAQADLTHYDLSQFKPMRFEIAKKEAALHMRLPSALLEAIKAKAAGQGVPYTRYVRMLLEADINGSR